MSETIKPQPLSPEQREEIEKRHQAATPGLYQWRIDTDSKNVKLISLTSMMPVVMAFWRWGMGHAAPVFRDAEHDLLRRVEHWVPNRERFPFGPVEHPDAHALAHSWADREALLSHIAYLEGEARKAVSHARLYAYDLSTRATEQSGLGNRALADKLFNDSERVSADGETLFAALGQTHQEGIEK